MYDVRGKSKAGKITMTFKSRIAVLYFSKNYQLRKINCRTKSFEIHIIIHSLSQLKLQLN